jgi:hypothetical protein
MMQHTPEKGTRARVGAIVMLLIIATMATACANNAAGQAQTSPELPITVTDSGFTVSLVDIHSTQDTTLATFRIQKTQLADPPALSDFTGFLPTDVNLTGASLVNGMSGDLHPIAAGGSTPPQISAIEDTLHLQIEDASQPITIAIKDLPFSGASSSQRPTTISGGWTFTFQLSSANQTPSKTVQLADQVQAEGVAFSIDQITVSTLQTLVSFQVHSQGPGRVKTTGMVAELTNGSIISPTQIRQSGDHNIAIFGALPTSEKVTFALTPILLEVAGPVSVSFAVDALAVMQSNVGDSIPLQSSAVVHSEHLSVTDITRTDKGFAVDVSNDEPNHQGRVLLHVPGSSVTLTDDLGNQYHMVKTMTNLDKSGPLTMWAGESSYMFAEPLASNASRLTLTEAACGYLLRGPWNLSVLLPSPGK